MKAEELRIGNIIKYSESDEIFLAYEIMPSGFRVRNKNENIWIEEWQFEGIEITQDWLIKLGFKKHSEYSVYGLINEYGRFSIWLDGLFKIDSQDIPKKIKYVHELQNLFYALTGKELSLSGT